MDKTQQNFDEAGSDISRKEQELNQQKEKNKLITTELDELKKSLLLKTSEANDLREEKNNLLKSIQSMTPEIEELGKHEDGHLIGSDSNDLLLEWNDLLEVLNKLISRFIDIKNIFQENLSRKLVNSDISFLDRSDSALSIRF